MALKNTKVDFQFYESAQVVKCFESIREQLLAELRPQQPDLNFTARELSILTAQIQQFQYDYLGMNNKTPNAPLRIPSKLFKIEKEKPLTKASPIYTILIGAYTHRVSNKLAKWDFSASKKAKNVELIQHIRQLLQKANIISTPKLGFARSMPDPTRKSLSNLAKKLQFPVMDDIQQATHILYGTLHHYDGAEEEWFRTLEKKEGKVLVHWWYYPDSYDNWLDQTDQFADPEEAPIHRGAWHITARWLQDTAKFNEIMNEEDYEEMDGAEDETRTAEQESHRGDILDTQSGIVYTLPKEAGEPGRQDSGPPLPVLNPGCEPSVRIRDIERERPQLGSRQRKNEFEPYQNGDIGNITRYTMLYIEEPRDAPSKPATPMQEDEAADVKEDEDLARLCSATPFDYSNLYTPPWFNQSTVHPIEKTALPEYFSDKKGEKEYMKLRNYMISAYRENPSYYLTMTKCKAALKADLLAIVRVHSFLEHVGLINSEVDPRRRIYDPYIDSEPDAGITSVGTQRDFSQAVPSMQYMEDLIYKDIPDRPSKWEIQVQNDMNPDAQTIFNCTSCGEDCSEIRYQNLKYKDVYVCVNCFLNGKFTSMTWKGEFLRVDKNDTDLSDEEWSEDEILRLLEGVEQFDDDWLAISEHVGSRSKEQCITQFLQLPINDRFLTAKLSEAELEELPFGEQKNPVMALIAFLSGHVNAGIGAHAAKRAIRELTQDDDAMDVDESSETGAFSREKIRRTTIAVLESAVEQAKKLAAYENRDLQHLTRLAIKTMIEKLNIKVQQYDDQDLILDNELREIEKQSTAVLSSLEALTRQYPNRALNMQAASSSNTPTPS